MDNKIVYDNLLITRLTFNEYINDIHTKKHAEAYAIALNLLLHKLYQDAETELTYEEWKTEFYKTHKLIELKNKDYKIASRVRITNHTYPFDKINYDLTSYWPNIFNEEQKKLSDKYIDKDNFKYSEIISYNYIAGTCTLRNRVTGFEFTVPLNYVDDTTPVSEDLKIDNLFSEKIYNKNFGY